MSERIQVDEETSNRITRTIWESAVMRVKYMDEMNAALAQL